MKDMQLNEALYLAIEMKSTQMAAEEERRNNKFQSMLE